MWIDTKTDAQRRRSHAENALKVRMQYAAYAAADADFKTVSGDEFRLAFSQEWIWFLNAMYPASPAYNIDSAATARPSTLILSARRTVLRNAFVEDSDGVLRRSEVSCVHFRPFCFAARMMKAFCKSSCAIR